MRAAAIRQNRGKDATALGARGDRECGSVADVGMTLQRGFDLAEVETMAAYLDLMIAAPTKQ